MVTPSCAVMRELSAGRSVAETPSAAAEELKLDWMPLDEAFDALLRLAGALLEFWDEVGQQNPRAPS